MLLLLPEKYNQMALFKAWLKKWWWTLLLALATIGGFILYLVLRKRPESAPSETYSNLARQKIMEAETDAAIARAKVDAKGDEARARLDEIGKVEDDFTRRKRLADYLDEVL